MTKFLPLILFTVLTNAAAQILLKMGMTQVGGVSLQSGALLGLVLKILFNPYVFLGLTVFVISMASHMVVLSKVDLSFAYPFLSLAYVVVTAYAFFIFNEDVGLYRVMGIGFIIAGTIFIAQS